MSIVMSRVNPVLQTRAEQLELNLLALHGGRPYVDRRLWRAANESDLSWYGSSSVAVGGDYGTVGRKQRTACPNDAGRVASKIEQYIFATDVARPGADEDFIRDVDRRGTPAWRFWARVNELVTANGWCWLQADRGRLPAVRTLKDREASGDRPVWRCWPALSVPDWSNSHDGSLKWLIAEEERYCNDDPFAGAVTHKVRTLWKRGENGRGATYTRMVAGKHGDETIDAGEVSTVEIPFVLVGRPSCDPWWFDDVEAVQALTMNLDSVYSESLTRSVYPQLIIPDDTARAMNAQVSLQAGQADGVRVTNLVREIIRGADHPITETDIGKGCTRYITPDTADLKAIPEEISRKRGLLFDSVGMALFNRESRQMQTAESKQWDHLDTEATLRNRSRLLQSAEQALVAMTAAIDTSFQTYEPAWPMDFSIIDAEAEVAALESMGAVGELTLTQRKVRLRAVSKILAQMVDVTPEEQQAIESEISELKEDDFSSGMPAIGFAQDGDDEMKPRDTDENEDEEDVDDED